MKELFVVNRNNIEIIRDIPITIFIIILLALLFFEILTINYTFLFMLFIVSYRLFVSFLLSTEEKKGIMLIPYIFSIPVLLILFVYSTFFYQNN